MKDIDECQRGTFTCAGMKKICQDNDGGYDCVCPAAHIFIAVENRCYSKL